MESLYEQIKRYQETNNELILETIMEEHLQLVYFIMQKYRYLLPQYEDVDLKNELLMEMQVAVDKYSLEMNCKFSTFCYTLMKNKLLNMVRKEKTKKRNRGNFFYLEAKIPGQVFAFEEVLREENVLEEELIKKEKLNKLNDYLKKTLKKEELELYKLYIYGKAVKEISVKLNISDKACRNKLTYIKRKLRNNAKNYKKT